MGKLKAVIPFTLAVIAALIATTMIYRWISRKGNVPGVSRVIPATEGRVVLAATDLAWGTKISPEMLKTAPMPKDDAPAGAFSSPSDLAGRVLITSVKRNEPIIESKLAPKAVTTGGVSAIVAPGKRAIAVAGDKVIGLAGFIQPGNYVDILVTVQDPQNDRLHYTKTVLEDIKVLATGTVLQSQGNGQKPAPVDVFTLEVTPDQAEKLSLAASQGKLHFALRNATDKNTVLTLGETVGDLLDSYRPRVQKVSESAAAMVPKTMPVGARSFRMEVINGTKMKQVSF